ncbi:MAG: CPBP family intramembrane metalloprotease [Actinomycetota bacterium]|nr:CPBP family intramembrane metalloprotease [Actinomycetota bacterium]
MTVAAVLVLLVIHNLGANLWVSDRWYVPLNLATAGVLVALVGPDDLGLSPGEEPVAAVAAALTVLVAVAVLAVLPATRPFFADRRMAGVDGRGTAWRALVRIPFGTVVLEEVAFRGVLPVLLSTWSASVLFGLWHVLPTVRTLDVNGVAPSPPARALAVGAAVAATAGVGLVLCWLRWATGSLLAPALVHTAANSGAVVAGYRVLRSAAVKDPAPDELPHEAPQQHVEPPA